MAQLSARRRERRAHQTSTSLERPPLATRPELRPSTFLAFRQRRPQHTSVRRDGCPIRSAIGGESFLDLSAALHSYRMVRNPKAEARSSSRSPPVFNLPATSPSSSTNTLDGSTPRLLPLASPTCGAPWDGLSPA